MPELFLCLASILSSLFALVFSIVAIGMLLDGEVYDFKDLAKITTVFGILLLPPIYYVYSTNTKNADYNIIEKEVYVREDIPFAVVKGRLVKLTGKNWHEGEKVKVKFVEPCYSAGIYYEGYWKIISD